MSWQIDFSANSLKFLKRNNLEKDFVINEIILVVRKFRGDDVNVDIRKLGGKWAGFYRIRAGRLRIIVEFQFERCRAYIEEIDWRGNAYK